MILHHLEVESSLEIEPEPIRRTEEAVQTKQIRHCWLILMLYCPTLSPFSASNRLWHASLGLHHLVVEVQDGNRPGWLQQLSVSHSPV